MNDTPTDANGAKACAWCGDPIKQTGVGRSRDYCRRSCRQRAFEQRQVEKQLTAHRRLWEHTASNSSRDESRDSGDSSRDETAPAGPAPVPPVLPAPEPVMPGLLGMGFGSARERAADGE
jgi:hypothetical protein